jgi:D-glycero-alpha-D-manno-heptose-7-phosphate kinase
MIVTRTPLRMSFVGGGTDLPQFADEHGGAVVSTAIDQWIRVVVGRRFEGDVRVGYSQIELVSDVNAVQHDLVRETMRRTGIVRGVDILTLADVPSRGTGLGSSSAVTVGLLQALYAFQGIAKSPYELAEEACEIEIEALGKPIGRQDQYAVAVGGMNLIEFLPRGGGVRVEPIVCTEKTLQQLHRSLMLFYTGSSRGSDTILSHQGQVAVQGNNITELTALRDLAYEMRDALSAGKVNRVGELLDRNWQLKRAAAPGTSTVEIDQLYQRACRAGAIGGKLLGAGGGGFFLVFAPPERQLAVRQALNDFREVSIRFAMQGSQVILLERE